MREYAALVDDQASRDEVVGLITGEFELTRRMLERVYGAEIVRAEYDRLKMAFAAAA